LKLVRQNNPEEVKKIIFGANKGIAKAQYTLGMMYAEGQGVPQDKKKALKWYGQAAQQDDPMDEIEVDKFENKNIPQELKFLTNDAENGIAQAQLKLGMLYAHGQGVPKDEGQARKWLRLAGEQGKYKAQYILGMMLADGQGITKDYVLAHMWYNLSNLQGNVGATTQISALEESMSPEQIEQAQKMVREWKPTE
jgi:TPR repeat protein